MLFDNSDEKALPLVTPEEYCLLFRGGVKGNLTLDAWLTQHGFAVGEGELITSVTGNKIHVARIIYAGEETMICMERDDFGTVILPEDYYETHPPE